MTYDQQLIPLLVRVAVAASIASFLARFSGFLNALMQEDRPLAQQSRLALSFGAVFGASAAIRVLSPNYEAVDQAVAGSLLAGLTGGYWTGLLAGVIASTPGMLAREWMTMPMLAGLGLLGGLVRDLAPDPEEIWRFSPVFDFLLGYRLFRRSWDMARSGFQLLFLCTVLLGAFLYELASTQFSPRVLHSVIPPDGPFQAAGYVTLLMCIALPLKIWNSARTERKLESQNRLLVEARLAALTHQINPHFLFNTLNSIASLVRVDSEGARQVIYRLSNILRRLLRQAEPLVPLRDELAFIDDYLGIEMVRFGPKLRFEKDVDPSTLDLVVPSMMLQPIVENSIKHGLAGKVAGGCITLRSRRSEGRLRIIIEDDGVGIPEERLAQLFQGGIGISNVNERLRVIYGDRYRIVVDSRLGEGTRTEIDLPDRASELLAAALAPATPPARPGREPAIPAGLPGAPPAPTRQA